MAPRCAGRPHAQGRRRRRLHPGPHAGRQPSADDRPFSDRHAVEHFRASTQPRACADGHTRGAPRLCQDAFVRIADIMVAADEITVRGQERVASDPHHARGKHLAVETNVHAVVENDIAVLARENRVASDEHAAANGDPAVAVALGVEQAVVVDDDVVPDADLVRMTEHDVLPEDHVAPTRAEERRIQRFAQRESEGARHPLRREGHGLVLDERTHAGTADNELRVFGARGLAPIEELILCAWDAGHR